MKLMSSKMLADLPSETFTKLKQTEHKHSDQVGRSANQWKELHPRLAHVHAVPNAVTFLLLAAQREVRTLRKLIGILALLIVVGGKVEAATIIVSNGELVGAEGVVVMGTLYDVAIVEGSCVSLFGGCDEASFTFHTLSDANAASNALLDQVFLNGPSGAFDDMPELTFGCEIPGFCQVFTPYMRADTGGCVCVLLGEARNYNGNSNNLDNAHSNEAGIAYNSTTGPSQVYAKWSLASVPDVTGTMSLLGVSVALMVGLRRAV